MANIDEQLHEDPLDVEPEDVIAVSSPSSNAASPPMPDVNEPTEVEVMVFILWRMVSN